MIALLTILSNIFIYMLAGDSENILTDNYNSVGYGRQMIIALSQGITNPEAQRNFKSNLTKQQTNNTEIGERDMTEKLTLDFDSLYHSPSDSTLRQEVRKDITDIMLLNMQAIQRKSKVAKTTADSSILWVSFAGTLCFLIALTMLFNLPGSVGNPIKELTTSIK